MAARLMASISIFHTLTFSIMKHAIRIFFASMAVMLLAACTASKTTVSQTADLSKYEYAAVINNDTYHIPAELMEYEIQLFDAVEASRLRLVSDFRVNELTPQQQERLLLVKYGVTQTEEESIVTVNFIDYMTGRPIASCRGAYGFGMSCDADLRGAIKRLASQIASTFPR